MRYQWKSQAVLDRLLFGPQYPVNEHGAGLQFQNPGG